MEDILVPTSKTKMKTLEAYCKETGKDSLLLEWDYEENKLTPNDVSYGSKDKVAWKCSDCGHKWPARIYSRAIDGNGCPKCGRKSMWETRRQLSLAKHNLALDFPDLAKEWDYEKNIDLLRNTPEQYTKGARDTVFWKCPKGHDSYPARIANRVYSGEGCPVCGGRRITAEKNLAAAYPFLAAQWDYEGNKNMPRNTPEKVFPREANKYWWICPLCKESFLASVSNRTAGKNHKKCSQKGTSFPEQATYYYIKKVFSDATNRDVSFGFELDIYIPAIKSAVEFDGVIYHKGKEALEKDNRKDLLCDNLGIKLYRLRDPSLPDTISATRINCLDNGRRTELNAPIKRLLDCLALSNIDVDTARDYYTILSSALLSLEKKSIVMTHPQLAREWHPTKNYPLTPDKVTSGMGIMVWWKCQKCGESFPAVVYSRKDGGGCPKCAIEKRRQDRTTAALKTNSLIHKYPGLIEEIDQELNPDIDIRRLAAGSKRPITWKCKKCGFIWTVAVNHRTRGDGCPKCGRLSTIQAANRAVINIDTGEEFDSLTAAAESCGGDKRGIFDCCSGRNKTAYGYHWKYKDPLDKRTRHTGWLIHNIETDEMFNTIQEAADKYGCDRTSISSALRGKTKTSQGCHWEFLPSDR